MEQQSIEETGKTIEEATERALQRLGIDTTQAKVEILEEPSKGIFGLGARPARVRILRQTDILMEAAGMAKEIVSLMGFSSEVSSYKEEERVHLEIKGESLGLLIGRRGVTLDALQYIVGLILSRKMGRRYRILIDVEGYRSRRRQTLINLAQRMAERVMLEGEEMVLEPMNPYERRIIHAALQDHRGVKTTSGGEGEERQVIIIPKEREDGR